MDRKSFLKKSLSTGAVMASVPLLAHTERTESTYNKMIEPIKQVGFNHMPNTEIQSMNTVLHRANSRGSADHGWLKVNHTFSFANYYNPERMHFGVLRVLNDDTIAGGRGFPEHPHDNMEIITIPLRGDLAHKDSMGNSEVIRHGDVQVMSAGTGVRHSEFNHNSVDDINLLQIWLFPNKKQVSPCYDQITLGQLKKNSLKQILSPSPDDEGVWIHQDAWFHMGEFTEQTSLDYRVRKPGNGVYALLIEGEASVAGQALNKRDGMGLWDTDSIALKMEAGSRILLMDIPMEIA